MFAYLTAPGAINVESDDSFAMRHHSPLCFHFDYNQPLPLPPPVFAFRWIPIIICANLSFERGFVLIEFHFQELTLPPMSGNIYQLTVINCKTLRMPNDTFSDLSTISRLQFSNIHNLIIEKYALTFPIRVPNNKVQITFENVSYVGRGIDAGHIIHWTVLLFTIQGRFQRNRRAHVQRQHWRCTIRQLSNWYFSNVCCHRTGTRRVQDFDQRFERESSRVTGE